MKMSDHISYLSNRGVHDATIDEQSSEHNAIWPNYL